MRLSKSWRRARGIPKPSFVRGSRTLSVRQLGRRCRIVALGGIGRLRHFRCQKNASILFVADGDPPDHPSIRALEAGLDHLILDCGANVTVAHPPPGKDANDLLTEHSSLTPLMLLLANATKAELSLEGECERLARMEPLDAAMELSKLVDRLHARKPKVEIGIGELRKEVERRRKRRTADAKAVAAEAQQQEEITAAAAKIPRDRP